MAPKAAAFILLFIFALGLFAGASAHVSAGADALSLDGECVCCEWLDNPFVLNRGASGCEFAFAVSIQ